MALTLNLTKWILVRIKLDSLQSWVEQQIQMRRFSAVVAFKFWLGCLTQQELTWPSWPLQNEELSIQSPLQGWSSNTCHLPIAPWAVAWPIWTPRQNWCDQQGHPETWPQISLKLQVLAVGTPFASIYSVHSVLFLRSRQANPAVSQVVSTRSSRWREGERLILTRMNPCLGQLFPHFPAFS